jgi:hypothetical protein
MKLRGDKFRNSLVMNLWSFKKPIDLHEKPNKNKVSNKNNDERFINFFLHI